MSNKKKLACMAVSQSVSRAVSKSGSQSVGRLVSQLATQSVEMLNAKIIKFYGVVMCSAGVLLVH